MGMEQGSSDKAIVLPEGEYAEYLADRAGRIAEARARPRETRWRTLITVVAAVLTVFGFTNITSMKGDLREALSNKLDNELLTLSNKLDNELLTRIPESVDSYLKANRDWLVAGELGQLEKEVDSKIAYIQFAVLVNEIEDADEFSREQRDAANALLQEAIQSQAVVEKPQFEVALDKLVEAYVQADLEYDIDAIDSILGTVITNVRGIVLSMIQHYGIKVAGATDLNDDLIARFKKYADACERLGYPEASIPFRLALAFRRAGGKATETTRNLLQDVLYLTDSERADFLGLVDHIANQASDAASTGTFARAGDLFREILATHREEFDRIRA